MPPDAGAGAPGDAGHAGWRIPFWALQVLELGVAFLLVTQSIHVGRGGILVVGGIVIGLLAVVADGPLGVVRIVGQRLHVLLVAGTALVLGALAAVPRFRPDVEGLLVVGAAVVAIVFLATRTMTDPSRRGRRSRRAGRGPVIDATATVVPPAPGAAAPVPDPAEDPDSALRRAGRSTGAAAAAGRKAVEEHRPAVEDQVKRTLRGAGRLAGRLAAPKSPPTDPPA